MYMGYGRRSKFRGHRAKRGGRRRRGRTKRTYTMSRGGIQL